MRRRELIALVIGAAAIFLLAWLSGAGSTPNKNENMTPLSVKVPIRPLTSLSIEAERQRAMAMGIDEATALDEVRLRTQEVRKLLRRSGQLEHELTGALNATREEAAASTVSSSSSAAAPAAAQPPHEAEQQTDTAAVTAAAVTAPVEAAVVAAAAHTAVAKPAAAPVPTKPCPAGCTDHGNCDAVTGVCSCPPTFEGPACEVPTMPACATGDGSSKQQQQQQHAVGSTTTSSAAAAADDADDEDGFVNLSGMAAEQFWWMLRDVKPNPDEDPRRSSPPFRWVGMVTCSCVRQALSVYSLQHSAEPAAWPRYIGHTEISMQRAVCVDAPEGMTVGQLWSAGGDASMGGVSMGEGPPLQWSYMELVAWLKPYPAHSPMILPPGLAHPPKHPGPCDARPWISEVLQQHERS